MYTDTVKQHFANPRNVGQFEFPSAEGFAENEADGDKVKIQLLIRDDRIVDARMKVMGCVAAIAAASMMTDLIKGKTPDEAMTLSKSDVADRLGGLPEQKLKCSVTCVDALKQAIETYRGE